MNIEFENYRMEPEDCRFNLYKKGESTKKETGEKYESETVLGYAMSFERCLHVIATDILAEKEKTVSINEWIAEYKAIMNKLMNVLK